MISDLNKMFDSPERHQEEANDDNNARQDGVAEEQFLMKLSGVRSECSSPRLKMARKSSIAEEFIDVITGV